MDGGEGSSHSETDSCAVNHHEQIGAQSEQPPKEVAEEVTVVENPAVAEEVAVAEEIAPPSTDIDIAIAIAIPLPEKHSSAVNEEATDANGKTIETTNDEQITNAGDKIIETTNGEQITNAGDKIIESINDERITEASSIAEHGEVTTSTTALGKRKPAFFLNADAEPWTPEDLEQSRALLSQSWKLGFPSSKKLLVLDVNGLLVARYSKLDKSIIPQGTPHRMVAKSFMFKRPFCDSFLEFCFENFYVGVWSSMMEGNVRRSLDYICKQMQHKLLFVMHQGDCTNTGLRNPGKKASPLFLKELAKVWCRFPQGLFNETNTLLIDDTPYKALWNPPYTAIFPEAYWYNEADDFLKTTLPEYLTQLRDAADVREFVRSHPIGEPAIAPGCLHWDDFYEEVAKRKLEENALPALPTIPATPPPPQTQIFSPELPPQTQISSPESVFSQEIGESFSCAETA